MKALRLRKTWLLAAASLLAWTAPRGLAANMAPVAAQSSYRLAILP